MTWQRIDENTYIDDTLVTCAEYQLFIDEMREQGKYYQPDHWISHQFPKGQAREPILGVRHSDAVTFCEWLTKRSEENWNYRIPSIHEAKNFSIKNTGYLLKSFWISQIENNYFQVFWVSGDTPSNPRDLDSARVRNLASPHQDFDERYLSYPLQLGADVFDRNLNQARFLSDTARTRDIDARAHDLLLSFSIVDSYSKKIANLDRSHKGHYEDVVARSRVAFNFAINQRLLFVDIFTVYERIAGHSSAFEGIRLVKEQIR